VRANKRIYLLPTTKNELGSIIPKNVTFDMFVSACLQLIKKNNITIEELITYLPEDYGIETTIDEPEMEQIVNNGI
jgi:hypothetical protein